LNAFLATAALVEVVLNPSRQLLVTPATQQSIVTRILTVTERPVLLVMNGNPLAATLVLTVMMELAGAQRLLVNNSAFPTV
jgi:hypothetical protein